MRVTFKRGMEYLFLGILAITIGFMAYFNLRDIRCSLDPDFASTIYHYMEVIKQGTLNIPNWHHTTSLELDGSMLLAVPIYFITHNLFTAVGVANLLIVILYIATIWRLLSLYKVERIFIYVSLILVLTPYEYGMLDYFNMMFYGGACYTIKTLVPILLLLILSLLHKGIDKNNARNKSEFIFWSIVYLWLLFATAFSTGIFVVLCGILPILIWSILEMFIQGTPKVKISVCTLWGGTFLTFLVGYLLHNKVYTAISRTNMNMTKKGEFANNFEACVRGIYELLGAITQESVPILSIDGIVLCVKLVLVTAFIVALFWVYFKFSSDNKNNEICLKNYLAFIFVWNFFVMFLADMRYPGNGHTEYRYFTIGIVPLIILFGIQLDALSGIFNEFQKRMSYIVLLIVISIVVFGNNKNVIKEWDRSSYCVDLTNYMHTLDVESMIFLDDVDTSVLCKGIDNEHKYGAYMSDTQSMNYSICSYADSAYGSYYGDKHVLAVIEGTSIYDCMPVEIADQYELIGKCRWFDIYKSDIMMFP